MVEGENNIVEDLIEKDEAIIKWLERIPSIETRRSYLYKIKKFFNWLWMKKGIYLKPIEVIEDQFRIMKEAKNPLEITKWADIVQEYTGLNGPLAKTTDEYRRLISHMLSSFFKKNNVPLGSLTFQYSDEAKEPLHIDLSLGMFKQILPYLKSPFSVCVLCLLYSGMRIREWLSLPLKVIYPEIKAGTVPIKIPLRRGGKLSRAKGVGRAYTFLGGLALEKLIEELELKDEEKPVMQNLKRRFSSDIENGVRSIERVLIRAALRAGMIEKKENNKWRVQVKPSFWVEGKQPFHPHALRVLFKTEATRLGIPHEVSEFWLGHAGGIRQVYDRTDVLHQQMYVKYYLKLSSYFDKWLKPKIEVVE